MVVVVHKFDCTWFSKQFQKKSNWTERVFNLLCQTKAKKSPQATIIIIDFSAREGQRDVRSGLIRLNFNFKFSSGVILFPLNPKNSVEPKFKKKIYTCSSQDYDTDNDVKKIVMATQVFCAKRIRWSLFILWSGEGNESKNNDDETNDVGEEESYGIENKPGKEERLLFSDRSDEEQHICQSHDWSEDN